MKTVYKGGVGEITEKKSRFIATVRPVESEDEASAFIAEMKKKYWDAVFWRDASWNGRPGAGISESGSGRAGQQYSHRSAQGEAACHTYRLQWPW